MKILAQHELIKHEYSFYNTSVRALGIPSLSCRLYRFPLVTVTIAQAMQLNLASLAIFRLREGEIDG